jgi:hypothetical protein
MAYRKFHAGLTEGISRGGRLLIFGRLKREEEQEQNNVLM